MNPMRGGAAPGRAGAADEIHHRHAADPESDCTSPAVRSSLACSLNPGDEPPLDPPTRVEWLHAEVARIAERAIRAAVAEHGPLPAVDTPEWWQSPDNLRIPGLLVHAMAWIAHDCEHEINRRFKAMSSDLSAARDWTKASRQPSHAELERRRTEPALLAAGFAPEAVRRWAETGNSRDLGIAS